MITRTTTVLSWVILLLVCLAVSLSQETLVFPDIDPLPQGIILGRPTSDAVTAHLVAEEELDFFLRYGVDPNHLDGETDHYRVHQDDTLQLSIDGLVPDTRYVYTLWTSPAEANRFTASDPFTFHTQRAPGSAFTFVVQADSHLDEQSVPELYEVTLMNALVDEPDFMIDLGDTFMVDKLPDKTYDPVEKRYRVQRSYFSLLCHSCPLYLVLGNHDGEVGWAGNGKGRDLAIWATAFRRQYFTNPQPDEFYTGSESVFPVGPRQNYYAWHWGDALFVVLDPYAYTLSKPGKNSDSWDFTLGETQYRWFERTLSDSASRFKFVFCHQIIGGDDQGRGGIEFVPYHEMGGHNTDGTWGFDQHRPDWNQSIHELMVENNVAIYFHGHDHFYARQELDGIVYQLVPQPSHHNYKRASQAQAYGYINGEILPNSGHLRVIVSASEITVDYVRAYLPTTEDTERINGQVSHTYRVEYPVDMSSGLIQP